MIEELQKRLRSGEVSARSLTEAALARIEAENGTLHAFITVCPALALRQADAADRRIAQGGAPPLCGIPMALKDNICTEGVRTTCASRILAEFVPPYSACVWERLEAEGAVLLGKTNMDEFAMGSGGENSAFGACRNPHDPACAAGGSSGGSAASVAAGMAVYALGTDTGGSVRVPAAYCGVTGLKPSYGRISRRGVAALASSLDQVGVLASSVRDTLTVLRAVAGHDPGDMTTVRLPAVIDAAPGGAQELRVGVPEDLEECASPAAARTARRAAELLEARGAVLVPVRQPAYETCYAVYYILCSSEASSNLARYDGIRYGCAASGDTLAAEYENARALLGEEVKRRILAGTAALTADSRHGVYERAMELRRQITQQMREIFTRCDILLTPTAPDIAYRIGAHSGASMASHASDLFTAAPSLAGLPAISLPAGGHEGLPLGVQLTADAFAENMLYRAAFALEEAIRCGV